MIDEKKLIEELAKRSCALGYDVIDYVEWLINNQPKVGEWIPCSERLPKYTDEYNVTVGVASEFGYYEIVTTLRFENTQGKKPKWIIPIDKVYRVIAWMPLPAPYNADMRKKVE